MRPRASRLPEMAKARSRRKERAPRATRDTRPKFVGRDPSPVLDRYPPRSVAPPASSLLLPLKPGSPAAPVRPPTPGDPATSPPSPASQPLITLDRPFDPDDFSTLLGENSIRITVPRDALPEVLRRVTEFMGFGIYVYAISVRPASHELLKSFVVELTRVDYSAKEGRWTPFEEKGTSDSPFGPSGDRT